MNKLTAVQAQSDGQQGPFHATAAATATDAATSRLVARVRLLMIISGLTTLIAIAAVVGVIGYRVYRAGDGGRTTTVDGIVVLPKGARVITAVITGDRIAVTLDIAGSIEIRTYDIKTLEEIGRIRFATEP